MFSGIIEEIGQLVDVRLGGPVNRLTIGGRRVLDDTRLGDSIAVNGVCVTVAERTATSFSCDVMPETLRRTNLGRLRPGGRVNLERAITYGGRIGGHYVQGHIDGTGHLRSLTGDGPAIIGHITAPAALLRYVVPKGFIAVDGASLTVVDVGEDGFSVSLVYHTQQHIILPDQRPGTSLNLEVDIMAKYVERALGYHQAGPATPSLTREFLARHGYA
jgi:riboflavin synthase